MATRNLTMVDGVRNAILSEYAKTVAPTANEDTNDGYEVGSLWHDTTNDKAYVCLDATAAAAVWKDITAANGLGYVLSWGADLNTTGNFAPANGRAVITEEPVLDEDTEHTVPKAGTLKALSWNTMSADATTVVKVHKNQVVAETVTLSGAAGADATLTTTVAAGDQLGVEFDAGTAPGKGNYNIYIE